LRDDRTFREDVEERPLSEEHRSSANPDAARPTTSSTLVSLIREFLASSSARPSTLDRFSVLMIVEPLIPPATTGVADHAIDPVAAERLWETSIEMLSSFLADTCRSDL
jgi:hypothetical protein